MSKQVYLAGPDVFRENAKAHLAKLQGFCAAHGLTGLSPLDTELSHFANDRHTAMRIFAGNVGLMNKADVAIANICPFRGPNMDPGTAFEIGYMHALGKAVFCYTSDGRTLSRRSAPVFALDTFPIIEEFGLVENLMIIGGSHAVYASAEDAILAAKRFLK